MTFLNKSAAIAILTLAIVACSDEKKDPTSSGSVTLNFETVLGSDPLMISESGASEFPYENALNQNFRITMLGYYISEIKLTNTLGGVFEDEVVVNASEAKGYYQIDGSEEQSGMILLENVPAGNYVSVTFTLGVRGNTVTEGAVGGVLDPANGAWFWSWNSGYVAFLMEGNSISSGAEGGDLSFHVGGWGEPNNVKEITLDFPQDLVVGDQTSSELHIEVDALEVFDPIDFSTTFAIHSPVAGQPLAERIEGMFEVHHVENEE